MTERGLTHVDPLGRARMVDVTPKEPSHRRAVAKGRGHSIINGQRYDWQERDIFCVPSWAWHEHVNGSASDDACLFCLSDLPVMRALGLYREQAFGDNGGHQPLTT